MWWIEMLRVALGAMAQNKLRATLTMLGIVIGVFSVVVMLGLVEGMKRRIMENISALAETDLIVSPGPVFNRGWGDRDVLTLADYEAVRDLSPHVLSIVPVAMGGSSIQFRDVTETTNILATTPEYFDFNRVVPAAGRILGESDAAYSRRVCVVGANVANRLGAGNRVVGGYVQLPSWGPVSFQVIGVLEPRGQTGGGITNVDDAIVVPIETSASRYQGRVRVASLMIKLVDRDRATESASDIARVLRRSKRLSPGEPNNFNIAPMLDFGNMANRIVTIINAVLVGIGSISLIVGGIGVMNIMLASVSERTREVGTRKALGATRRAILAQFAIEAVVLCATGGCIAIALGLGLAAFIKSRGGALPLVITPEGVAIAFGVSAAVGLIFGIGPAWRAARLDPVDALRVE